MSRTAVVRRHRIRRAALAVALVAATALATSLAPGLTTRAAAAPADLDAAFAGAGRLPVGNGWRVVAVDRYLDERMVTVSLRPGNVDAIDVRRWSPLGAADPTFAGDGDVQVGAQADWVAPALVLDRTQGYVYVSAYAQNLDLSRVWRFTPAGALDVAWGGIGRVDFAGARFTDLAIQPDGGLVVASNASVYRLSASGALDPTFGSGGGVALATTIVDALVVQPDGKIVAGGRSATVDVFRLQSSGSPDRGFGNQGKAFFRPTPPPGWVTDVLEPVTLGVQNDGSVVVAGGSDERNLTTGQHQYPSLLVGFTKAGSPQPGFDTRKDYASATSGKLTVQADDKVVVGYTVGGRAALIRYLPDGSPDTGFGSGGVWVAGDAASRVTDTLVQGPGRIVATGLAAGGTGLVWALVGDPTPRCEGRYATAYGGSGPDTLRGTDGDDVIVGGSGKDSIDSRAGADRICGGQGRDVLVGGRGDDRVVGGADPDYLRGYDGADLLLGGGGGDRVEGNGGQDRLKGGRGDDRLFGGPGRDTLKGGQGRDVTRQ